MEQIASIGIQDKDAFVVKLIFSATSAKDNVIPFSVIDTLDMNDINAVSFCMGDVGVLSRVMSVVRRTNDKKAGFLTYASLEAKTAPGQIHVDDMVNMLEYFL